jgi:hypothetical protein
MKYISIFLTVISIFFILNQYENYKICTYGQKITTILVAEPEDCKGKYVFPTFKYNGQMFNHRFGRGFCEDHKIGDTFEFYCHKKYPNKYVLASMKYSGVFLEFFSSIAIFFLGIIGIYYTVIKK